MNKKIIIFNWKGNPYNTASVVKLAKITEYYLKPAKLETVIIPPFTFLKDVKKVIKKVKLGAQNVFWENAGYYTGEISPKILKNLGVEYVIIGHSERRKFLKETDEMINKKVSAALKAGLKVILCVGEPALNKKYKEGNIKEAKKYIKNQIQKNLKNFKFEILNFKLRNNLMIAYEPAWAISTGGVGKICKPEDALRIIKYIKQILNSKFHIINSRVLYGGSIDGKNIKNFIKYPEIDGFLVGGASLKQIEVKKIIKNFNFKVIHSCK